ncbi:MAG: phytanoyl-CoA dioxygenase family protein [Phaeodactylibacter sp.]|nr:phytanoyl-CoA dioxygenase family protein [Phaeodactylibacter sp.]
MKLTKEQLTTYQETGMLLLPELFSNEEVAYLKEAMTPLKKADSPELVWEKNTQTLRALHGCHLRSPVFRRLVRQKRLLEPSRQMLNDEGYVYQFKINLKQPFNGELWPWHQDFIFWHKKDGMPLPNALNAVLFLDDCTEFNGSMWFIPNSHHEGLLEPMVKKETGEGWKNDVGVDLTYQLDEPTIARLVEKWGIAAPKGKSGTVLFFHPNLVHASLPNISPLGRSLLIVTYNSAQNIPVPKEQQRPWFLVNPDTTPEVCTEEPLLLTLAV